MKRFDDTYIYEHKQLFREIQEIKAAQFIGVDSVISYRVSSGSENDLATTLEMDEIKKYLITYTHARSVQGSIITMTPFYSLTSADVMSDPVIETGTNPGVSMVYQKVAPPQGDKDEWVLAIKHEGLAIPEFDVYIKLFFEGTDNGTFSIIEI